MSIREFLEKERKGSIKHEPRKRKERNKNENTSSK
jgi:hypothetical protein